MSQSNYSTRAKYYDLEFSDQSDHALIRSLITHDIQSVLDIPCGSGRNIPIFHNSPIFVTFADISQNMLNILKNKLSISGINNYKVKNINMINNRLNEQYDLILVTREAMQLFDKKTIIKVISNLKRNLKKGGLLYLDFVVFNLKNCNNLESLPRYIRYQNNQLTLDLEIKQSQFTFKRYHNSTLDNGIYYVRYHYKIVDHGKDIEFNSDLEMYEYQLDEIKELAESLRLKTKIIYGNYKGDRFKEGSERMIFLLTH